MKSMDGSTARRAPRVSMYSGREVAPIVYKPEQDCFNYLMKPIPCPAGADDFFELDLDDLIDDSQRLADLCSYYDVAVQEIGELATKRPKIDCERALGAVSLNLLTQLLRHLKAPFFLAWEALYSSEKFVFEQIVDLLSCVGWNQSSLCQRWYAVFAEALLWYFPKSKAAGAMVDLLLRFCGDVAFHRPNSFAEKILKSIETHNLLQATVYPKMISSLLANPNRRAVELAAKHLLNRIHIYAAHFDFRMLPEQLCADQKLKEQFCLLLRPIKTMLSMKVKLDISPSLMAAIRVVFSADFCMKYLSSSAVPLSLKADLVTLSSSLFVGVRHNDAAGATLATGPETAVPVEDFVLSELRGMRSIFRLDVDVDFEGCSAYCIDFICRAAMARVREQLMRAAVLSVAKVNGHVYLAISSAVWTGGIPNRSVAHFEAEKMRQEFAVAYPSGLMDGGGNPKDTSAVADSAAKSVINTSDLLIDGSPSPIPAGQEGVVAYSVFQIALLVLNILGERDGLLMSRLNDAQRFDIIWISAAVDLMIDRHPQHISNPKGGVGAQEFHFRGVKDRLVEVYHGMIVEMLAKRTESNIRRFCATALTKKAWEQFCEVSMASPQQASATLLSRAGGGSGSEAQLERSRFSGSMSIAVEYPIEYLMASPPARFLKETLQDGADFLDKNGILLFGDFRSPVIKSAAFVRKFSSFTDFDLWMKGSGRYLQSVMSYLEKVTDPDASEYNFLHLLTGLLQHNIEEIRESRLLSLNVRIALLERETARLRRLQLAMKDLGALKLITQLVGNCNHHASEAFVWNYAPLALSLANGIISWQNTECQELIIESIETGIRLQKPPEMNCLVGLQFMIRKCALVLSQTGSENVTDDESDAGMGDDGHEMISESAAVCGRFPQGEQTRILRSVKQLFLFVGSFCKGDNAAAQSFFSAQEDTSRLYVDVIQELSQLANAVLTKFATTLEYIRYDEFYDRLGPLIWDQKDANRRRMFAWHNPKNNIALLTQYLFTISNMFDSMLSLCNHQTVVSIQQAIVKCPEVLEFTGLMQMVAVSHVPSVNAVGLEVQRAVYWHCGEPIKFYRTYFHELALMEMVEEDPDTEMICEAVERWHRGKANRTARVFRQRAFRDRDFRPIFGVSFELFMEQVKKAEGRCLSVILAFFSFGAPQNIADMSSKFDDGILTAQLNNSFQSISKGSGKSDLTSATAVSYLSILERIGVQFPETRELLNGWETKMMRRGMDPKRVFGAVEIINKQGKIQRLYFPIPQFVLMYWPYPEVQKMKDKIVLQVSRASPEEKLADFRQWMDRIIKVMKRQELLRTWLTFPVHMIFGGKSLGYLRYLPSKRMWALLLTLLFNCYYVYFTSLPSRFDPPHGSIANYLVSDMNNSIRMGRIPNPLEFLKVVLLALHFTMFLSKMLNSYVLIDLFERFESKTIWVDVLLKLAVLPYAIFLLLVDAGWELILVCLSFVGAYFDLYWFYAPMLLDVAFQVRFMRFLFDAVALNGSKITYTMLLAFLILYFYAVIATLYFNGQYDLDGHFGCSNVVSCFKLHLDYGIDNVPNWAGDFYIDPDLPLSFLYGPLLSRILGTVYSLSYVLLINLGKPIRCFFQLHVRTSLIRTCMMLW